MFWTIVKSSMNSSQDQCQQCSDKLHQGSSLVTGARMYLMHTHLNGEWTISKFCVMCSHCINITQYGRS